jgi:hypothetical protein
MTPACYANPCQRFVKLRHSKIAYYANKPNIGQKVSRTGSVTAATRLSPAVSVVVIVNNQTSNRGGTVGAASKAAPLDRGQPFAQLYAPSPEGSANGSERVPR